MLRHALNAAFSDLDDMEEMLDHLFTPLNIQLQSLTLSE